MVEEKMLDELATNILGLSEDIRYAAIYHCDRLVTKTKHDIRSASNSESDKYEEL